MERLVLISIGGTLAFPSGNQAAINQFARDHSEEIIAILFPGGIGANTIGQSENQKALNDRDIDQDLTYGINVAIPYRDNLMINIGAHPTNSFASDVSDDRDTQTKVRAVLQYKVSNAFEINGGYSTVLEIKDFTTHMFFLNAIARF